MLNSVNLIGRLCIDPEMKYTPSGVPVMNMRIAVDRKFKDAQGNKQTDFIDLVLWRQSAEFAAQYLNKGRLVCIEGSLQVREYTAQDGQKRKSVEVSVDSISPLDKAPEQPQYQQPVQQPQYQQPGPQYQQPMQQPQYQQPVQQPQQFRQPSGYAAPPPNIEDPFRDQ